MAVPRVATRENQSADILSVQYSVLTVYGIICMQLYDCWKPCSLATSKIRYSVKIFSTCKPLTPRALLVKISAVNLALVKAITVYYIHAHHANINQKKRSPLLDFNSTLSEQTTGRKSWLDWVKLLRHSLGTPPDCVPNWVRPHQRRTGSVVTDTRCCSRFRRAERVAARPVGLSSRTSFHFLDIHAVEMQHIKNKCNGRRI